MEYIDLNLSKKCWLGSSKLLIAACFLFGTYNATSQAGKQLAPLRKLLCKEWVQNSGSVGIEKVQYRKPELVTSISLHDDNSFEYFNGKNIAGIWRFNAADSTLALKSKETEQIFVLVYLNGSEMKLKSYFDKHKSDAAIMRFVVKK